MRPVIDNRHQYGTHPCFLTLPSGKDGEFGEAIDYAVHVQFTNCESGYPHDQSMCREYLLPGRVYQANQIRVGGSSSQIELRDFPGVWFNTVMFCPYKDHDAYQRGYAAGRAGADKGLRKALNTIVEDANAAEGLVDSALDKTYARGAIAAWRGAAVVARAALAATEPAGANP